MSDKAARQMPRTAEEAMRFIDENFTRYILDENHEPKKATAQEYIEWRMSNPDGQRVGSTHLGQGVWVSTVFLPLPDFLSLYLRRQPMMFETMVFSAEEGKFPTLETETLGRYRSWNEAVEGHKAAVSAVEAIMKETA